MHPCGHFGQTQSWADAYLSPNHLAGLSYLGKSLQTGKSKGHISLQLKAGLWADDLLWDPSFTIGTIWNGKRGDLHPSGTRTRSQEVNYGPKLFHQLVGLRGSGPVQVELCSLTKGKQASWQRPCLRGRGYLPKRALPSHEAVETWGENILWLLLGWVPWTISQPEKWRASESLSSLCFMLIRCVRVSELLGLVLLLTEK